MSLTSKSMVFGNVGLGMNLWTNVENLVVQVRFSFELLIDAPAYCTSESEVVVNGFKSMTCSASTTRQTLSPSMVNVLCGSTAGVSWWSRWIWLVRVCMSLVIHLTWSRSHIEGRKLAATFSVFSRISTVCCHCSRRISTGGNTLIQW